jgi:hypothetical protein
MGCQWISEKEGDSILGYRRAGLSVVGKGGGERVQPRMRNDNEKRDQELCLLWHRGVGGQGAGIAAEELP